MSQFPEAAVTDDHNGVIWNNMKLSSHSPEGQKSIIKVSAVAGGSWSLEGILLCDSTSSVAASSRQGSLAHRRSLQALPPPLLGLCPLCDLDLGHLDDPRSSHLQLVNSITSAKTLSPNKVTITGSRD